ncbi:AraC family transcriptional regulator [Pelomonas sp. Root1217]|uniref:AraC family transcriptional regulator n=1 Tax=Pelomonas sp. Root1217 TaxID=1736430 RepID=UPI000709B72B|nr:AraC family transcriptional regulator [Pelomonas sp. Root1217]KQV60818.1 AraC family transcriptional regulator [Pelomonas sp. Root1217]
MTDPLAEVVGLLQPGARFSKVVAGAGDWRVRRADAGLPFYVVVLEGACRLTVDGQPPLDLQAGDFALVPASLPFTTSSAGPAAANLPLTLPERLADGSYRVGNADGPVDVRLLVGHCSFGSPDAALLVSLLPQLMHVRGEPRLTALVRLLIDETGAERPARDEVLARLLEVLLIEALRCAAGTAASPGLVRGLADVRLAAALRRLHEAPAQAWTVASLAREAALSRSAFFERFNRAVGVAPMSYLLAWRMALARRLLRDESLGVADVAERVGYSSASTFSVAFTRHVGQPPARYARSA